MMCVVDVCRVRHDGILVRWSGQRLIFGLFIHHCRVKNLSNDAWLDEH